MKNVDLPRGFTDGLNDYAELWAADMPLYEGEFVPSPRFERRIRKVLRAPSSLYHTLTLTTARKAVCLVAALLALLLLSISLAGVRKAHGQFLIYYHREYNAIQYVGPPGPDIVETTYNIDVPDGYTCIETSGLHAPDWFLYENQNEDHILFSLSTTHAFRPGVDNTDIGWSYPSRNGTDYILVTDTNDDSHLAYWSNGVYIFEVHANGMTEDQILTLCQSVHPCEE